MAEGNFVKIYLLEPREGMANELIATLHALVSSLSTMDECVDCTLLIEPEPSNTVVFMERWRSAADYRIASNKVDAALFAPLARVLATKPQVRELGVLVLRSDTGT